MNYELPDDDIYLHYGVLVEIALRRLLTIIELRIEAPDAMSKISLNHRRKSARS